MKRFFAWGALVFGLLYFALPLIGMTNFSLKTVSYTHLTLPTICSV